MAKTLLKRIFRSVTAALYPPKCPVCGTFYHPVLRAPGFETGGMGGTASDGGHAPLSRDFLQAASSSYLGPYVCRRCMEGFLPVRSPLCIRCGEVFKSDVGQDHECGVCIENPKRFHKARSAGLYELALMSLVHSFKYRGKIQLARPLGQVLFAAYLQFWRHEKMDYVIPVPLHPKRFRNRGFNQAYLLVRDWNAMSARGFPIPPVMRDLLVRNRWTAPQAGLRRKERMVNLKNAFSVVDTKTVVGKNLLLVDDVYTTGTTAEECAAILMEAGADRVDVLTLARA